MNRDQAIDAIKDSPLCELADQLIDSLIPSARIVVSDEPGDPSGNAVHSHFGGLPLLPDGTTWPRWDKTDYLCAQIARLEDKFKKNARLTGLRDIAARKREELSKGIQPLSFLCQLSLAEMSATAPLEGWPSSGTLGLFFDSGQDWGFDPQCRGHCRVLYLREHEQLAPVAAPEDLADEVRFPERALSFTREWTLPTRLNVDENDLSIWGNEDYAVLLRQLAGVSDEREPIHRCGGHPQEVQRAMQLECQLVTNGLYCGDSSGYKDPRRAALESGAADWQLLIQIDSDETRLGWMWGDVGRVYFWIRRQDLEAADFDGAWALLQCY